MKFTIHNFQFSENSQFSIFTQAAANVCSLISENSLKIAICYMKITPEGSI